MSPVPIATLPATFRQAAFRGVRCGCPRCGEATLFGKWLKPRDACPACGVDWSPQRADDFPAYIAIFVTGHLLAPLIIMLSLDFDMGPLGIVSIILPLTLVAIVAMLQPCKGAVIAAQWWYGLHGFRKERLPAKPDAQPDPA